MGTKKFTKNKIKPKTKIEKIIFLGFNKSLESSLLL